MTSLDQESISADVKKMAEAIREFYIDKEVGSMVANEIEQFVGSDKWKRIMEAGNIGRLLTNLNCILVSNADDAHFHISYGSGYSSSVNDAGIERFTPHYIRIREFASLYDEFTRMQYMKAFAQFKDYLIIDLRECPGGSPELTYFILCHLFPDDVPLIELKTRTMESQIFKSASVLPFYSTFNTVKKFNGKVKVLVNGNTASAAESLAYVIQHMKRGTIYGARTAGHAHIQNTTKFGEFHLHLPYAKTCDPETHKDWEGIGINPDYQVGSREYVEMIYSELVYDVVTPANGISS